MSGYEDIIPVCPDCGAVAMVLWRCDVIAVAVALRSRNGVVEWERSRVVERRYDDDGPEGIECSACGEYFDMDEAKLVVPTADQTAALRVMAVQP